MMHTVVDDSSVDRPSQAAVGQAKSDSPSKVDEFALLIRIVKLERIHFLKEISYRQLFSVTQKDVFTGDNVLHYAVLGNKGAFVEQAVDLFENELNMRNEDGNTPLAYACLRGNLELVKLLHQRGALPAQRNQAGLTPLMLAVHNSHYFVVHYLLGLEEVVEAVLSPQELFKLF